MEPTVTLTCEPSLSTLTYPLTGHQGGHHSSCSCWILSPTHELKKDRIQNQLHRSVSSSLHLCLPQLFPSPQLTFPLKRASIQTPAFTIGILQAIASRQHHSVSPAPPPTPVGAYSQLVLQVPPHAEWLLCALFQSASLKAGSTRALVSAIFL